MPFKPRRPAGGFKVMYEYANRLSELGYSVHLTYPIKTAFMEYRLPYFMRCILTVIEGFRTSKWFKFNPKITMSYVPSICEKNVIDADIIFVTWWSTALEVGKLSSKKGKKINLIQGFENWTGHEDLLYKSYDMPDTTNIVVASYLKDLVQQHTKNETVLIPNAINSKQFFISVPVEERSPLSICMLYSIQEIKGSDYGIKSLNIVKEKHPDLKVDLFGICPEPEGLPDWMIFHREPSNLYEIYNKNAIFVSNSLTEGFGLVSVEAMSCGCALVCTDILGHREYAIDKDTALLVEVKNPEDTANKICHLIDNNQERIELAIRGNDYVKHFSWEASISKMNNLIKHLLKKQL